MTGFLKKLKALVAKPAESAPPPKKKGAGEKAPAVRVPEEKTAAREKAPVRQKKEPAPRKKEATAGKGEPVRREPEPQVAAPAQAGAPAPVSASSGAPAVATAAAPAPKRREPQDPARVNLADAWEIQYRRKQFGCTEQQLRQAVAAVGDAADKVKLQLRKRSVPPKGGKQRFE